MANHSGHNRVDVLRKSAIVAILVGALLLLHQFSAPSNELPPTALALGFVILAAFAIGELVEVIGLPHITGYLLAGLVLGPSTAHIIHQSFPSLHLPPPFDLGVLNEEVKSQLLFLDDLALALIALTAGGELKLEALKKGIRQILGVLGMQVLTVGAAVMGFVVLISGVIPAIGLPQLAGVSLGGAVALGAVLGSIALATSPAATIAVINGTGAKGETTDTILSIVVLKDVVVVVCFSAATAVATSVLGVGGEGSFVGSLYHIAQALGIGVFLGLGAHFYLRYVGSQVLLFLVGTIYTATFVAGQMHLGDEVALMFIVAGFVVGNFSDQGETLIHEVERLSLPVYVVFFTLAGAKLHLDVLWAMAGFAVALVAVRMLGIWLGSGVGARLSGASSGMRKYGWMGFVSQAGLAITLATSLLSTFPGDIGDGLFSLVLGGVAINEMLGPVLLQWGLGLAGETSTQEKAGSEAGEPSNRAPIDLDPSVGNPWGPQLVTRSDTLNDEVADLEQELRLLVRDLAEGPLERATDDGKALLKSLRRGFLRIHRRSVVAAQSDCTDEELAKTFRVLVGELGGLWREVALDRSARLSRQDGWQPLTLIEQLDDGVLGRLERIDVPVEDESLTARQESLLRKLLRGWYRIRVRLGANTREVPVRGLARYHFGGRAPARLEGLAAILVHEEARLAGQTSEIFGGIARAWEHAAGLAEEGLDRAELLNRVRGLRDDVDGDIRTAEDEMAAAFTDGSKRVALVLGHLMVDLKRDVIDIGTPDLSHWARRYGRVYGDRNTGLEALSSGLRGARKTLSARWSAVALELELMGLEGLVRGAVEVYGAEMSTELRGKGSMQLARVDDALGAWNQAVVKAVAEPPSAQALSAELRTLAAPLTQTLSSANREADALWKRLGGEEGIAPLMHILLSATSSLTDWYTIPAGPLMTGDWTLPKAVATSEIAFREVAVALIESTVTRELSELAQDLGEQAGRLAEGLAESERVVAFNVELACGELDVLPEGASVSPEVRELVLEMVVGAISRARGRIVRLREVSDPWPDEARERLRHAVVGALEQLRGQVIDGDVNTLRSLLREDKVRRRLASGANAWLGWLPSSPEQVKDAVGRVLGPDRTEALRMGLGLPDVLDSEEALIAALRPAVLPEALPVVYRRLFSDQALHAGDLIIGREHELDRLNKVVRGQWGQSKVAAVVGPRGSGTSALATAAARAYRGGVRVIELTAPVAVDEVERWFKDGGNRLTVLSGIRWLFRNEPGGFAAVHALMRGLSDSHGRAPWVFTADVAVFDHLCAATDLDQAIGTVVRLGPLAAADLTAAVLARHEMSGYDLVFEAGNDLSWQVQHLLLRGENVQHRHQTAWFHTLLDASGGVVHDALRLWQASIHEVDETQGVIRVGPVRRPPLARISALPEKSLVTLHAIMRQGWADAALHSAWFMDDSRVSRAHLQRLQHLGLLEHCGDERYQISRHLRGPVQRVLASKGWLK